MAVIQNIYTGDGTTVLFSFSFPYLSEDDVKVSVNGSLVTNYVFSTSSSIQFLSAPSNGAEVRIFRDTNIDETEATIFPGSAIKAQDLNDNFTQNLYSIQEVSGYALQSDGSVPLLNDLDANGNKIINLASPSSSGDAVNKNYVDTFVNQTANLANSSVTTAKLADGSVTSAKIVDGTIAAVDLGSNSVTTAKILDSNVTTSKIADSNITTAKLDNGAVTEPKLSSNSVTTAKIVDANVTDAKLATPKVSRAGDTMTGNLSMSGAKVTNLGTPTDAGDAVNKAFVDAAVAAGISDGDKGDITVSSSGTVWTVDNGSITSAKIADGTIVNADISAAADIAGTKISPNFGSQTVQTTGVFSHALGAVGTPSITFTGDLNTGIYSPGADQVAISTNSVERVKLGTSEVVFNDGGNDIDFRIEGDTNANLFFVDASTDRVGLGTSSPGELFHLQAGSLSNTDINSVINLVRITDLNSRFNTTQTSSGNFLSGIRWDSVQNNGTQRFGSYIYQQVSRNFFGTSPTFMRTSLVFGTRGDNEDSSAEPVERLRINHQGNVGIGTTSPGLNLEVQAATGNSNNAAIRLRATDSTGSANGVADIIAVSTGTDQAALTFSTRNTSVTERARIDSSGRLLIGTSTARANFFNATASAGIQLESSGDPNTINRRASLVHGNTDAFGPYFILGKHRSSSIGGTTVVVNNDEIGGITFQGSDGTEFVEGARIQAFVDGTPGANDMPGRIVLSTTADGASSPTERMRISQNGWVQQVSTDHCTTLSSAAAAGTTFRFLFGKHSATLGSADSGTISFNVFTNGNVTNTNNSYGAISDIKLKENIVDANPQWNDLKALQVRNYNFKEGQTHTQIGLIAQEVELVSPGLVTESPDRDAEGNDLGTVTKSVNYSVLYMKAVKALQEAMERIEVLEQRLTDAGIA
jgi:hypothetical protein